MNLTKLSNKAVTRKGISPKTVRASAESIRTRTGLRGGVYATLEDTSPPKQN
jgi:hypothetical protein